MLPTYPMIDFWVVFFFFTSYEVAHQNKTFICSCGTSYNQGTIRQQLKRPGATNASVAVVFKWNSPSFRVFQVFELGALESILSGNLNYKENEMEGNSEPERKENEEENPRPFNGHNNFRYFAKYSHFFDLKGSVMAQFLYFFFSIDF